MFKLAQIDMDFSFSYFSVICLYLHFTLRGMDCTENALTIFYDESFICLHTTCTDEANRPTPFDEH